MRDTRFTRLVGIEHAVVQAPMAGGLTTPGLVAAVSEAGALGSFAAALLSPDDIRAGIAAIRALTSKPFGVNLFSFTPPRVDAAKVERAQALLERDRVELGFAPRAELSPKLHEDFDAQLEAVLEGRPRVVSFAFGIPSPDALARVKATGALVIGTATHVAEARAWATSGADVVCAQGAEAGGHRGTFLGEFEDAMIGTLVLVPQIADAVDVPVLAAGGIMDGRAIAAVEALGADGAQLGTAFLTCTEAGTPPPWRAKLLRASEHATTVMRAFTGRPARGFRNAFVDRMRPFEHELPDYPIPGVLGAELRREAMRLGRDDLLAFWAGEGAPLCRELSAAELVHALVAERDRTVRALR